MREKPEDVLETPLGCWLMSLGTGSCLGWLFLIIFPPLAIILWVSTGLWGFVIFPILYITGKLGSLIKKGGKK